MKFFKYILVPLVWVMIGLPLSAADQAAEEQVAVADTVKTAGNGDVDISEVIFGHIEDTYEWQLNGHQYL